MPYKPPVRLTTVLRHLARYQKEVDRLTDRMKTTKNTTAQIVAIMAQIEVRIKRIAVLQLAQEGIIGRLPPADRTACHNADHLVSGPINTGNAPFVMTPWGNCLSQKDCKGILRRSVDGRTKDPYSQQSFTKQQRHNLQMFALHRTIPPGNRL